MEVGLNVQERRNDSGMVYLIREVDNKRIQSAPLVAPAKVFEGMGESDCVFKVSAHTCQQAKSPEENVEGRYLLAQLVDEVAEALAPFHAGHASIVRGPSGRRWQRHVQPSLSTRTIVFACVHGSRRNKKHETWGRHYSA
jgi:hypothetical protein